MSSAVYPDIYMSSGLGSPWFMFTAAQEGKIKIKTNEVAWNHILMLRQHRCMLGWRRGGSWPPHSAVSDAAPRASRTSNGSEVRFGSDVPAEMEENEWSSGCCRFVKHSGSLFRTKDDFKMDQWEWSSAHRRRNCVSWRKLQRNENTAGVLTKSSETETPFLLVGGVFPPWKFPWALRGQRGSWKHQDAQEQLHPCGGVSQTETLRRRPHGGSEAPPLSRRTAAAIIREEEEDEWEGWRSPEVLIVIVTWWSCLSISLLGNTHRNQNQNQNTPKTPEECHSSSQLEPVSCHSLPLRQLRRAATLTEPSVRLYLVLVRSGPDGSSKNTKR